MNTYVCFHRRPHIKVVVAAHTSLEARDKAAALFKLKPNRYHEVTAVLAQKGSEPVLISPAQL